MVNTILCTGAADLAGDGFQIGRGVAHGNAVTDSLKHFYIVVAVTESHCILGRQAVIGQNFPDTGSFSAGAGDDVYGPVPPGGDFCTARAFEDGGPVAFAAAHQQLENFTSGDFIELIGNDRCSSADGVICRQIVIRPVGKQLRPSCNRHRTTKRCGVLDQRLHILRRDGAGKNISATVVAVGAVVGEKDIELHAVESRHNERRTPGGDGQQDAVLL